MASGNASNSCFVICAPKGPDDEGDTGGGGTAIVADPVVLTFVGFTAIVAEFAADAVVAVVFLLPLLLLFS